MSPFARQFFFFYDFNFFTCQAEKLPPTQNMRTVIIKNHICMSAKNVNYKSQGEVLNEWERCRRVHQISIFEQMIIL